MKEKMKKLEITKRTVIKGILIILLFILFITIFCFSNQNGEDSSVISRGITRKVAEKISHLQELGDVERELAILKIEVIIRKLAHFSLYMAMGIILMALVIPDKVRERNKVLCSLWVGVMYAITDELHQIFVPMRTAKITDVLIDTCGVITGIVFVMLCTKIIRKIKNREKYIV